MGFGDKLKAAFKKIKTKLIVYGLLVVVAILFMVVPFTVAVGTANLQTGITIAQDTMNGDWWGIFLQVFGEKLITFPTKTIGTCFQQGYIGIFASSVKWVFIVAAFFALIGLIKAFPKHEFQDIENGSSDWCEGGEQYKVLSKNKGLVLAEKNYLPLDKRGNINILVVRRFWCW